MSKAGLDGLIAAGIAPTPEVFLIDNETEPPVTDQFNAGVRTDVRGILVTPRTTPASAAAMASRSSSATAARTVRAARRFPAFQERPDLQRHEEELVRRALPAQQSGRTTASGACSVNYTLGQAEAIGGDLFSLDYRTRRQTIRVIRPPPTNATVSSSTGIVGLPYDIVASTFMTLASGLGFTITDNSRGSGIDQRRVLLFGGRPADEFNSVFNYQSVDFRVEKIFRFAERQQASIAFEAFNLFNHTNFSGLRREYSRAAS